MSENLLGPASVQYNDLVGTSAADESDNRHDTTGLKAALGLESSEWSIVGYSLYQSLGDPKISVFAANRHELGIKSFEDYAEFSANNGAVPVTQFFVTWPGTLGEFVDYAFKRFDVHLVTKGFSNAGIQLDVQSTQERTITR
jgi:hypothetical protein